MARTVRGSIFHSLKHFSMFVIINYFSHRLSIYVIMLCAKIYEACIGLLSTLSSVKLA